MTSPHFLGKISLRAIVVRDGKVLISRDVNDVDTWEIPGGRLHEGESLEEGLKREIQEELGVDANIGALVYSEQFHQTRDGSLHLLLTYEVTLTDPTAEFRFDPHEVAEVKWISKDDLKNYKLYENCLNALNAYWR